ncbi:alpha/beta hydrolase [Bacillus marinisedimentorum]|uniref:alpha/beta hydrolase n=1 Tax=Bacillus marinisedimentorum TaxID=1821260 RepID=UPI0008733082|nr:alpha/beta hydrolase [Bacillus marinisedimentorum]
MKVEEVLFNSDDVQLSGYYFVPDGMDRTETYPAIVMAHGFSLVKEAYLPKYAEVFAKAGLAVLLFDYRNFGDSEGEPRQHMDPNEQIKDYRNAISWLSNRPEIDRERIGIWGTSYSGGHVLHVAAVDKRVKAAVSQVPTIRGWIGAEKKMGKENMQSFIRKLIDYRNAKYNGAPAEYIKVVSGTGDVCAQTHPEAYPWFTAMAEDVGPNWENRITLDSMEHYLEYYPAAQMDLISPTPLMMIVAAGDGITPPDAAIQAFETRVKDPKKLVELPGGHFDVYDGETFSLAVNAAKDWFLEHLTRERDA